MNISVKKIIDYQYKPIITIGVRCKNEIKYIPRLIESLFESGYDPEVHELLFLDSGSSDGTLAYLSSLDYPLSLYSIPEESFEFGSSCNLVMEISKGEYVVFLSAHVEIKTKEFFDVVEHRISEGIDVGYFRQVPNTYIGASSYEKVFLTIAYPSRKLVFGAMSRRSFSNAGSLVKKSIWETFKFPNVLASEDKIWEKVVVSNGIHVEYMPELVICHSHNEPPSKVYNRVKINKIARYGNRKKHILSVIHFVKIFCVLVIFCGKLKTSFCYAVAHAKAYL